MPKMRDYLIRSFSGIFFSIFLPIIAIATLILFIRIAKLTEVTQMSFGEMVTMYGYFLPTILFYTVPITFFAALMLTMVRLSNDFENIVLFSFGISPMRFIRFFTPLTLVMTALLLLLSLALIPITKQLIKSFINYKSVHAIVNIEASKFGQKFGDWLVFLESKDKECNVLHHIVLYNHKNPKEEQVLIADKGGFFNENGVLGLELYEGRAYKVARDKIEQIDFKKMKIYDTTTHKPFTYRNLEEYWRLAAKDRKRLKDLIIFIAVSLFPVATLFFAFAYGILHPRYDRNYSYAAILAVTVLYYGFVSALAKSLPVGAILFILLFIPLGWILFYRRVLRRF